MSKIQLMGSGAFDVYCPTKRVYFRPETPADTIRVGDQVCYNSDSILDHKERAADPSHLGLTQDTYVEGSQEFTGRLFIVEKPASANLHAYAGVVKSLGPEAGADGDMIEIWVPTVGAVVPVMTDLSVTYDSTILTVANGAYEATSGGRPIGIALETVNYTGGDGLAWMRFMPEGFAYQKVNGVVAIPGIAAAKANDIRCSFTHTSGYSTNFFVYTTSIGALAATGGVCSGLFYLGIEGSISATTSYTRAVLAQVVLSGTINGSNIHLAAVHAQIGGSPTFTACAKTSCLWADIGLGVTPTSGQVIGLRISNNGLNQTEVDYGIELYGGYGINYLFNFDTCAGITGNFISNGGTGGAETGITSGGDWKKIKVSIDGSDFFLLAMVDPVEVDMVS